MQLIELDLGHSNFFCPATGQQIVSEDFFEPSPATRGVWNDEMTEEPQNLSDEMEDLWNAYVDGIDEDENWIELPDFLRGVDQPNWVTFAITTSGLACGPVSSTVWIVIDMDDEAIPETGEEA